MIDNSRGLGRWPANVPHDGSEEAAAVFPDTGKSGTAVNRNRGERAPSRVGFLPGTSAAGPDVGYGDGGSAARFFAALTPTEEDAREALEDFEAEVEEGALGEGLRALYVPKAPKRDREEGCEDLEPRQTAKLAGAEREEIDDLVSARFRTFPSRNDHPTVKPTALMRYLCRLITPPGGVVLDPFAGSGSTGKAALLEGFHFLGIEKTPRYVEIAKRRCAHAEKTAAEAKGAAR
jgi:site-specific DNA-methyltransferase (adenine-specific)